MKTLITEHRKCDFKGWHAVRSMPADDPRWSPADRAWITTLEETGEDVLTLGDTMYQAQWIRALN